MTIAAKLDEGGKAAWIAVMIAGFVIFWPAGLAVLAYMIWSGRMGCMHNHSMRNEMRDEWRAQKEEWKARKRAFREEMRSRWHGRGSTMHSSGNSAFDDYKAETLKRLEEEQAEFNDFLENLRKSRDKAEFDEFMKSRRNTVDADEPKKDDNGDQPSTY